MRVWCLGCMYSGLVGGLLFAARAVLLAFVGGLAFLLRVCPWGSPAPVSDFLYMPDHQASLKPLCVATPSTASQQTLYQTFPNNCPL